jgi:F-type H+-transporting ATPase subunit epsilon
MSAHKIHLKIVTPERIILEEDVDQVTLPTMDGEITILPGHIPLIAALRSGDIVALANGEQVPIAAVGGFIEFKDNELAILADFAEPVAEISEDAVEKAVAKAKELQEAKDRGEVVDFEHFEAELERSLNRVKIADKWKSKKYRK